jgi:hypothetical protein
MVVRAAALFDGAHARLDVSLRKYTRTLSRWRGRLTSVQRQHRARMRTRAKSGVATLSTASARAPG